MAEQRSGWPDIPGSWNTPSLAGGAGSHIRLLGPFVLDHTTLTDNLQRITLFTPQPGDVMLRVFPDITTLVPWTNGQIMVGQDMADDSDTGVFALLDATTLQNSPIDALDNILSVFEGYTYTPDSRQVYGTGRVLTASPIQAQYQTSGGPSSAGHADVYVLVATPTLP